MRAINKIIVHYLGPKVPGLTMQDMTGQKAVDMIRGWHKAKGWLDIGYHYLIDCKGNILNGRPDYMVGAHCLNENYDSLGVNCLFFEGETPNELMINGLIKCLYELCQFYKLNPKTDIYGHRDFLATQCPDKIYPMLPDIRKKVLNYKEGEKVEEKQINKVNIDFKGSRIEGLLINSQSYIHVTEIAKILGLNVTFDKNKKLVIVK